MERRPATSGTIASAEQYTAKAEDSRGLHDVELRERERRGVVRAPVLVRVLHEGDYHAEEKRHDEPEPDDPPLTGRAGGDLLDDDHDREPRQEAGVSSTTASPRWPRVNVSSGYATASTRGVRYALQDRRSPRWTTRKTAAVSSSAPPLRLTKRDAADLMAHEIVDDRLSGEQDDEQTTSGRTSA